MQDYPANLTCIVNNGGIVSSCHVTMETIESATGWRPMCLHAN